MCGVARVSRSGSASSSSMRPRPAHARPQGSTRGHSTPRPAPHRRPAAMPLSGSCAARASPSKKILPTARCVSRKSAWRSGRKRPSTAPADSARAVPGRHVATLGEPLRAHQVDLTKKARRAEPLGGFTHALDQLVAPLRLAPARGRVRGPHQLPNPPLLVGGPRLQDRRHVLQRQSGLHHGVRARGERREAALVLEDRRRTAGRQLGEGLCRPLPPVAPSPQGRSRRGRCRSAATRAPDASRGALSWSASSASRRSADGARTASPPISHMKPTSPPANPSADCPGVRRRR